MALLPWRHVVAGGIAALVAGLLPSPALAASRFFEAEEVAQAHELRRRVLDRVPGLAQALDPSREGAPDPATAAELLRRLGALGAGEASNPFYHWALGELRERMGGAAAADFERAAALRSRPLVHWLIWEALLERGRLQEADAQLAVLQEIYLRWGLMQFPRLADQLVQEGRQALAHGSMRRAATLLERAIDSDPSHPAPHFLMASVLWQRENRNGPLALRFLISGIVLAWQSRGTQDLLEGSLLGDEILALRLGLLVLAGVLLLRCWRLLGHDLRHAMGGRLAPAGQAALLAALVVPLALGLGLGWAALLVLVACIPYLGRRERLGVAVMVLLLLLLPAAYRGVARTHLAAGSPQGLLADEVEAGARGDAVVEAVRRWAAERPEAYAPAYLLGLVEKRRGRLGAAEEALRRATTLGPHPAGAWVVLGNVHYLQGEKDRALEGYAKAGGRPGSALAHRNAALIHVERFEFDRARQAFEDAFRADPGLASLVSAPRLARVGSYLADERLREAELREALRPRESDTEALAAALWGGTFRGLGLDGLPFAVGATLLALWAAARWGSRQARARACGQCGTAFCPRCQAGAGKAAQCAACAASAAHRLGMATLLKVQRRREAEGYRERRRRMAALLALCLPGGGHIYLGRVLGGLCLLLPSLFLLAELLVGRFFWLHLKLPGAVAWLLGGITLVPPLALCWALSAARCARLLGPEE